MKQSYAQAFVDALIDSMERDARVSLIGSAPLGLGPERLLTNDIRSRYPERVSDPPTSECCIASIGAGAAMAGARPFVDMVTGSFIYLAWNQLANEAANGHLMSGGQLQVPVVYHCLEGIRGAGAPQHSQSPHAMLWNAPGIQIVLPATAADVYGLVCEALRSPNPTFIFSHARILGIQGEIPSTRAPIPFGRADIKRHGRDVTVVALSISLHHAMTAADILAAEGIDIEVIDPRTLVPLDEAAILDSVERTGRLVAVDEAPLRCGVASEIAGIVAEKGFHFLKAPIQRVARPDVPIPYSAPLEKALTPGPDTIVAAVRKVMARGH
jgi:pyruvate dehydrogenase E1 component beta subunit